MSNSIRHKIVELDADARASASQHSAAPRAHCATRPMSHAEAVVPSEFPGRVACHLPGRVLVQLGFLNEDKVVFGNIEHIRRSGGP